MRVEATLAVIPFPSQTAAFPSSSRHHQRTLSLQRRFVISVFIFAQVSTVKQYLILRRVDCRK